MTFEANGFDVTYGNGLTVPVLDDLGDYVIVTQPEPWALVSERLRNEPLDVIMAGNLSPENMDLLAARVPPVAVVGLGGGAAMDTAKWIHWRRSLPLVQFPSLPSVDACFTRPSALRDKGGVRYEGDAVPDMVYVDFELFRAAPRSMVTSGIGDVLSCHTAWYDWKLAAEQGKDEYGWTPEMPAISRTYLDELYECAPGVAAQTDDGLRRLMELLRDIGRRCHEMGHARFEEGSEHFFAYAFEEVTGRTILHGELVAMGVLIMSYFQGNAHERVRETIARAGTRHRLADLGVTADEVMATLRRVPSFSREQNLWWSQAQLLDSERLDRDEVIGLLDW